MHRKKLTFSVVDPNADEDEEDIVDYDDGCEENIAHDSVDEVTTSGKKSKNTKGKGKAKEVVSVRGQINQRKVGLAAISDSDLSEVGTTRKRKPDTEFDFQESALFAPK